MIKSAFKFRPLIFLAFAATAVLFPGFSVGQRQDTEIVLQNEPVSITPKEFFVAGVVDEREDRGAIASLLASGDNPKAYPVDLQGGGISAIKTFIDHNLPRNTALRPVVVSLRKCMVSETPLTGGRVEGKAELVLAFSLQDGDDLKFFVAYNGSANYTRTAGPAQEIEPTLRHLLESGLIWFNGWIDQRAPVDIKLARAVAVTFTDHSEIPEGDTIYYSAKRPLTWDDFKSTIPSGRFDAEVYPTMGYSERIDVKNAVIKLGIDVRVCLPKSACWVKEGSRNDYTLNHEQRHFDIAKIAAEHLKQKIESETLPVANYDGPINSDYLDAYREMDSLQTTYDKETRHGADRFAQEEWNKKIDKELLRNSGSSSGSRQ